MKRITTFLHKFPDKWFIIGLFLVPILAWIWPEIGAHNGFIPSETINMLCIAFVFFFNGMTLKKSSAVKTIRKVRLLLFIQAFCFLLFPFLMFVLDRWVIGPLNLLQPQMVQGLLIMSCLPITTSSCVILTKIAKGDQNSALLNALVSNLLGIVLAPLILHTLFHIENNVALHEPWSIIGKLSLITLFPMLLGYSVRLGISEKETHFVDKVYFISALLLLYVIYAAFCETFLRSQGLASPGMQMTVLIFSLVGMHFLILAIAILLGRGAGFSLKERKAILFTVPQKTVALGIPLVTMTVYAASDVMHAEQQLGLYLLPLLIYNNIQMLVAGPLAYIASQHEEPHHETIEKEHANRKEKEQVHHRGTETQRKK